MNLNELNTEQKTAVTTTEGPLLILAGAGSGKTKTITWRIAYLINELNVSPLNILAITFTNKAAREMKDRIEQLIGPKVNHLWARTFHSACLLILRMETAYLKYNEDFVIYDDADQLTVMKQILKELNLSNAKEHSPRDYLSTISHYKNMLIRPEDIDLDSIEDNDYLKVKAYKMYQKVLLENNAMDFDDIINETVYLFRHHKEVLARYQDRFQYIHVDEYQDTNFAQNELVHLLAAKYQNICVVGDDDQSIYGWRGAEISNILEFEKNYENVKIIKLEENYRSTSIILDAANSVIKNNNGRKSKTLKAQKEGGDLISLYSATDGADEAFFIVRQINQLTDLKYRYNDIAILCRTTSQFRTLEEMMLKHQIPYQIYGGIKFYQRKEIKDAMAYLIAISNPNDSIAMKRALFTPKRGVGEGSWLKIENYASENHISLIDAMEYSERYINNKKIVGILYEFSNLLKDIKDYYKSNSLSDTFLYLMDKNGYMDMLMEEDGVENQTRIDNINQLHGILLDFEADNELKESALSQFLSEVALYTDLDKVIQGDDVVSIMTLHSAKGLEFPVVFLVGMDEKIFPHIRSMDDFLELEEERRLCYVGITRAEEKLFMTHAERRSLYGQIMSYEPSRFLDELPTHTINDLNKKHCISEPKPSNVNESFSDHEKKSDVYLDYLVGDKVIHDKWGKGVIVALSGQGMMQQISVAFPEFGVKKLIAKYAPIRKANNE